MILIFFLSKYSGNIKEEKKAIKAPHRDNIMSKNVIAPKT